MLVDQVVALHQRLDIAGIGHAFGGALALAYHAPPRGTREIDINVFVPAAARQSVLDELHDLGLRPSDPPGEPFVPVAGLRCQLDGTRVDLFFSYDDEFFASVEQRAELHLFTDTADTEHVLPFLSAEDLAVFKITFDRPKDWVDIRHMLQEQPLDAAYVERWLLHLRGDREWPRIRRFRDLWAEVRAGL